MILTWLLVPSLLAFILFPLVWGILLSLKTRVDALSMPPNLIFKPRLDNYREVLISKGQIRALINSGLIATGSTIVALTLSIPAAFGLSRFKIRAADVVLVSLLGVRMVPAVVIGLPIFIIFSAARLLNTYTGIILMHAGFSLPIAIWILKVFFDSVPPAIDDAARLDGDSRFGLLLHHIIPLSLPGLMIATVFCFINSWNELFLAMILCGERTRPLTVAVPALVTPHGTYWGQVMALSSLGLLPAVLAVFAGRKLLTKSSYKGAIWK